MRADNDFGAKMPAWVARLRQATTSVRLQGPVPLITLAAAVGPEVESPAPSGESSESNQSNESISAAQARYVVCRLGAHRLAIAADSVLEVRAAPRCSPLPGLADFVRGVAKIRDHAVPVIGLARLMGIEAAVEGGTERMLLIRPPGEEQMAGLIVDGVVDFALLDSPKLLVDGEGGELAAYLREVCQFEGGAVRVLDVEALLSSGLIEMLARTRRTDD